jgi:hypothetical protein
MSATVSGMDKCPLSVQIRKAPSVSQGRMCEVVNTKNHGISRTQGCYAYQGKDDYGVGQNSTTKRSVQSNYCTVRWYHKIHKLVRTSFPECIPQIFEFQLPVPMAFFSRSVVLLIKMMTSFSLR